MKTDIRLSFGSSVGIRVCVVRVAARSCVERFSGGQDASIKYVSTNELTCCLKVDGHPVEAFDAADPGSTSTATSCLCSPQCASVFSFVQHVRCPHPSSKAPSVLPSQVDLNANTPITFLKKLGKNYEQGCLTILVHGSLGLPRLGLLDKVFGMISESTLENSTRQNPLVGFNQGRKSDHFYQAGTNYNFW